MAAHTHDHAHDDHTHDHHDHAHDHDHDAKGGVCCTHHDEIQTERSLLFYLVGMTLLIATRLAAWFLAGSNSVSADAAQFPALLAALVLGYPLFRASIKEILAGFASSSSLAALAIAACIATGKYETAGWIAFILLVVDQFLRRTANSAQRVIEQLVRLTPNIARLVTDGVESEVPISQIKVGDIIRVRAGENLPIDGVVATGRSSVDQASLTGEALPHEVQPGDPVYAGTTNLSSGIDIRATLVGEDTTIGKVTQLIRTAERTKTQRQLIIDQISHFYVPVVLSIAFLVWMLSDPATGAERAINVLIVTCPSALLISAPTAMVAAFAAAARLGIMVKDPRYLEAAANVDTVVFDKTGTITTGKFAVARLAPATGVDPAELLSAAANGEQQSNHPLARSILATAATARIPLDGSTSFEEIHGRGVKGQTTMGTLHVGRATWLLELFPHIKDEVAGATAKIEGMSSVHVMRDGRYLGAVGLEDRVRTNTKAVIDRLRELGVRRVGIFTGDRLSVAERVGRAVGADMLEAECHPEEKHELIRAASAQGRRTLMVGDGINDGPSLAAADVGVAMGLGGSDIATNSAGVALMNDDLSRIPFLIELSRRARAIITQNITAAGVVAVVGLALASTGRIETFEALIFHFIGDIFVVLNAFRLFRFGEQYATEDNSTPETLAPAPARREASVRVLQPMPASA